MLLICTRCGSSNPEDPVGVVRFDKYEDWLSHLVSGRHRSAVEGSLKSWKSWENDRSVLVENTDGLSPRQVVEYFSKFGMVGDFFYSKNMKVCVVRVDSLDGRKPQLNGTKDHRIGEFKVKVKDKSSVASSYWNSVLSSTSQLSLGQSINDVSSQDSTSVGNLRVEAKNDSRQVTVVPGGRNEKDGKNKLKGIFGAETTVPLSPVSLPSAVIRANGCHQSNDSSLSTSLENRTLSPVQLNSPSKSKKSKSKSKNKKDKKNTAKAPPDPPSSMNVVNVEVCDAASDSGSAASSQKQCELSVKLDHKPELDFRGGFQVSAAQRPPSQINIKLSSDNGPEPSSSMSQAQPTQIFQVRNAGVQQIYRPGHPGVVHHQGMARPHVQAQAIGMQRQRGHFPRGPPPPPLRGVNNLQQMGPQHRHLQDPYAQQRLTQQYSQSQFVYVVDNRNMNGNYGGANQSYQNQSPRIPPTPTPRSVRPKYQELFFEMIESPKDVKESQMGEMFTALPLQEQLTEFLRAMTLDERGIQNRKHLVEDMQWVLRQEKELCYCKVYPFGSFITGLGDIQSDVDIYVDAYGTTEGCTLPAKPLSNPELLNFCKRILNKAKCPRSHLHFCNHIIAIREARVPILKLKHVPTRIQCDLSFENLISVRNSEMISLFMSLHPVVKPLMILLRYWGKFHCLTGSNSIKNYALNLLVLVYLANQGIIPSIADIQKMYWTSAKKGNKKSQIIDGWDTSFCTDVSKILKEFKPAIMPEQAVRNLAGTIITLALGFFELYANADFESNIVCTLTAEFLPKSLFNAGYEADLPEFLERYKEWSARQTTERRLNVKACLCIQDPFVLSFNIGSVCPQPVLLKFQVACVQSMNILKNKQNYRSLLDAFSRLPVEVGDRKFISLQERQKQTIKLIQEVKEQFDGSSKTLEEEPAVAVAYHLLPLQDIVDKKTIVLGKGWQSYQIFQPDNEFQEAFSMWMRKCQLTKKLVPESLFQNLKKLWTIFVEDFFKVVWRKCFQFELDNEYVTVKKRLYSGPSISPKFRKTYETLFMDKKEKKNKDKQEESVSPESVAQLVGNLKDLDSVEEKIVYVRTKCSSFVATWERRDKLLKKVCPNLEDCLRLPTKEDFLPGKEKPKKKKKERRQVKSARLKLNKNPLEIEEEITQIIIDSKTQQPSSTPLVVFYCLVKMDFSIVDELPTVNVVFEKDKLSDDSTYIQSVSTLSDIIGNLLPEYTFYRLGQWLGEAGLHVNINNSIKTDSASNTESLAKGSQSKLEAVGATTNDENNSDLPEDENEDYDQDLLLPPSSDESGDEIEIIDDTNGND